MGQGLTPTEAGSFSGTRLSDGHFWPCLQSEAQTNFGRDWCPLLFPGRCFAITAGPALAALPRSASSRGAISCLPLWLLSGNDYRAISFFL